MKMHYCQQAIPAPLLSSVQGFEKLKPSSLLSPYALYSLTKKMDAVAAAVAVDVLKRLSSLAADEVVLAWGYNEKLETLRFTSDIIRNMVNDAEGRKAEEHVKDWLKQLNDVVGEVEYLLDEVDYEKLRREVKARDQMTRKVPLPSFHVKKLLFPLRIAHKIENIVKKLSEINDLASRLGLQNKPYGPVSGSELREETDSYLDEFEVVGRENDELRIIQLLTKSGNVERLTIVPIVGMGGIGKTTLAKSVYNNPQIQHHFGVRYWVCLSVKVNVNTFLIKIYEAVAKKKCEATTNENLIAELRKEFGERRYLLVLDDVWDEETEHWDDIRSCMLKINLQNGSAVLLTTRKLKIGNNSMTDDLCTLQSLTDGQCWSIFKERAFVSGRSWLPELEEIGYDIVKKCYGLPLLVKVLASTLRRYTNDKEKWLSIKDRMAQNLKLEEKDRVLRSLEVSFDNLPNSNVKRCFAYCATFEKDAVMERGEVVQLWMSLGLVQADERRNKEMEDVGNEIFLILVSNSLFQDVEEDEFGFDVGCKMHDLVHDLLLELSEQEILRQVVPKTDDVQIPSLVKHLFLDHSRSGTRTTMTSKSFKKLTKARTLQTLFYRGWFVNINNIPFQRCMCLRILNLKGCYGLSKLTASIGELVHLRYLDLSFTKIRFLPKSICKLYHLLTLKLLYCHDLEELPKGMKKLVSLCHLEFDEFIHVTPKVGELTSLHTLSMFGVGREKGRKIEELGGMKHLGGELCIRNLEAIQSKEDAAKADLFGKKNLYKIKFLWSIYEGGGRNDKDVLEGMQPNGNVKSLIIENFSGDGIPAWVNEMTVNMEGKCTPLDKLLEIRLDGCRGFSDLTMLGSLPLLRNLVLIKVKNLRCLSRSRKPLSRSLRSLRLIGMDDLENWVDGETNSSTMLSPVLEKLDIIGCKNISVLDECHHHPLVSLEIRGCSFLKSIQTFQGLTSLESLVIASCDDLSDIPDLSNQSHSLKYVHISYCRKLTSFAGKFDCLVSLNRMSLGPFSDDVGSFPSLQGIEKLGSHLCILVLKGGGDNCESLPEEVKHLAALTDLTIVRFGMRELPIWLANMPSLQSIRFFNCRRLEKKNSFKRSAKGCKSCPIKRKGFSAYLIISEIKIDRLSHYTCSFFLFRLCFKQL